MPSLRHQRVRELLKRQIGEVIRREFPASDLGIITVNEVGVSNDIKSAVVYVGVVGSTEQRKLALATLKRERTHIQSLLAKTIVLKYTPKLRFVLDESVERGDRVLKIIAELEKSPPPDTE